MSLNSPWPGIIKFFPARESLVSDIPAGDGKIADLFLQLSVYTLYIYYALCISANYNFFYLTLGGVGRVNSEEDLIAFR
jgi:hypothetical protein